MKIGVFGGTFNPIHVGHLSLATQFADQLGLDRVLLIPTAIPPHKPAQDLAPAEHRLNLCRLAAKTDPRFVPCDLELRREGPSYTVMTLRELRNTYPKEDEFFLLMGSDMFLTFESWFMAGEIALLCTLCGGARNQGELEALQTKGKEYRARSWNCRVLDIQVKPLSSTQVRKKVRQGEPVEGLLPPQGEEYIRQNGLYGLDPGKYVYDIAGYVAQMKTLLKDSRRIHSLYVAKQAVRLAKRWGENETYALVAGLLHDIQKNVPGDEQLQRIVNSDIIFEKTLPQQPKLWHAAAGAIYLRDVLNIHNLQILNAVRYHTTGRANMTRLEQIVYLADLTSKDRTYGGVEKMRKLADTSLDDAMREAMEFIIGDLLQKKSLINSDTLGAYNYYVAR